VGISALDQQLMKRIDEHYTARPFYGSRKMKVWLNDKGYTVSRKKVSRLMRQMGLEAIYAKPRLSRAAKGHRLYPYLLRDLRITRPDQAWCADITYVRLKKGFVYLVAVMDWWSRYVVAWEVSLSLDAEFCVVALERALKHGEPEIFNTDQGAQFTSERFLKVLEDREIQISMDGKGRALDNAFIERLWRSVKYEEVYLHEYESVIEAVEGLREYFRFYNQERFHQSLAYRQPAELYYELRNAAAAGMYVVGARS